MEIMNLKLKPLILSGIERIGAPGKFVCTVSAVDNVR